MPFVPVIDFPFYDDQEAGGKAFGDTGEYRDNTPSGPRFRHGASLSALRGTSGLNLFPMDEKPLPGLRADLAKSGLANAMTSSNPERPNRFKRRQSPGHAGSADSRIGFLIPAALIVALSLILRLYRLGSQELWLDEAGSYYMATLPGWLSGIALDNTPPLYNLLLRGFITLFGSSEAAVRLLSVLAGTLFVAATIWAGKEIFNSRAALWAGLLAAVSPIHIYYSQEARAYVLALLALAAAYALLVRAMRTNRWLDWALLSLAVTAAFYSHYLSVVPLFVGASLLLFWPAKGRWPRFAVAYAIAGMLLLPWSAWSYFANPRPLTGLTWIPYVWEQTSALLAIPLTLEGFALGGQAGLFPIQLKQFTTLQFPVVLRILGLGTFAFLGFRLLANRGGERLGIPWLSRRQSWLLVMLLGPLVALELASLVKPMYVLGRYDVVAYPAFPLLAGLALEKIRVGGKRGALWMSIIAFGLLVPTAAKLFLYYGAPLEDRARPVARRIDSGVRNGDVVVFMETRGVSILYYLNRLGYQWKDGYCERQAGGRRFYCRMFPRSVERTPAAFDPMSFIEYPGLVGAETRDLLSKIEPEGTLWVAFESASWSEAGLDIRNPDALLVHELQRLGWEPRMSAADSAHRIVRFRKSRSEPDHLQAR